MESLPTTTETILTPLYEFRNHLVNGADDLPRLPEVVQQILECSRDVQANARKLAAIISGDAAISSRILKTVNSAYYGFPGQITSIRHAVVLIGFREVVNLAIGLALTGFLEKNHPEPFYREFRGHSLGTANFALLLARKFNYHDRATVYTGGLLHDFGMLMLFSWRPDTYKEIISLSLAERQPLAVSERELLGFDHLEAGKLVGYLWRLPEPLQLCMYGHNSVKAVSGREPGIYLAIIDLANILSYRAGFPATAGIPAPGLARTTWRELQGKMPGLKRAMLEAWIEEMRPSIKEALMGTT